jgi:hypothetical protein
MSGGMDNDDRDSLCWERTPCGGTCGSGFAHHAGPHLCSDAVCQKCRPRSGTNGKIDGLILRVRDIVTESVLLSMDLDESDSRRAELDSFKDAVFRLVSKLRKANTN